MPPFSDAKVVILCGGQGTRMREETEYRPKPMVEVGGRPLLWHIMKIYAAAGLTDFVCCLGYRGSMIKQYFLEYRNLAADVSVEPAQRRRRATTRPRARTGTSPSSTPATTR